MKQFLLPGLLYFFLKPSSSTESSEKFKATPILHKPTPQLDLLSNQKKMDLRKMLKRSEEEKRKAVLPMIADDEDDFKGGVAKTRSSTRAVAKKSTKTTKRPRRPVLKDSDSEDESGPPPKNTKTTPKGTPISTKKVTPGKSPGASKTRQKTLQQSLKTKKECGNIADYFGRAPIQRTPRPSTTTTTTTTTTVAQPRAKPLKHGSKTPSQSGSRASSEVVVIPESPTEDMVGVECAEATFDDATFAQFMEDDEIDKAKIEEQQAHEDEDFSKTLSAADNKDVATKKSETSKKQCPIKKLSLMMEKVQTTPTKTPTKKTPPEATPTKTPQSPTEATPTKKTLAEATPTKKTLTEATPTKKTLTEATSTKKAPTSSKKTPKKTPSKSKSLAIGTRSSPRLNKKAVASDQSVPSHAPHASIQSTLQKALTSASPQKALTSDPSTSSPAGPTQSTLQVSRKAVSSKRSLQYTDDDDDAEKPPSSLPSTSSPTHPAQSTLPQKSSTSDSSPAHQTTLLVRKKAVSSKRSIQYLDDDDEVGSMSPPSKVSKQEEESKMQSPSRGSSHEEGKIVAPSIESRPSSSNSSLTRISESPTSQQRVSPPRLVTPTTTKPVTLPHKPAKQVQQPAKPVMQPAPPPPPSHQQATPKQERKRSATPKAAATTPSSISPSVADSKANYIRYLNRSGPKHLGAKEIPEGAPNCLEGLTFVITGVLDSLEREDAADIIKKYGGKVTGNVSGRTSYLVVGEEAGESKLAKAEKMKTTKIDEDGLLDLIRTRPTPKGRGGIKSAPPGGKGGKKKSPPCMGPGRVVGGSKKVGESSVSVPAVSKTDSGFIEGESTSPNYSTPVLTVSESPTVASTSEGKLAREKRSPECLLWVDKYRPLSTQKVIGQQGPSSNAKKLSKWLQDWDTHHASQEATVKKPPGFRDRSGSSYKAALLSGPPGIGKTTTAQLVCQECGYTYVEMNASSCRNKSTIRNQVASQLSSLTITAFLGSAGSQGGVASGRKHALIMDEVDGMDGNADRGGISELISLIKSSHIPVICICNDRQKTSIRSLANHCYDLAFQRPNVKQICAAVKSICFKEGIKIGQEALTELVVASGQDIRQVLHNLSLWSASEEPDAPVKADVAMEAARNAKKHSKMNPFNVVRAVFHPFDGEKELTLFEKSDLFFHDYSLSSLFVQENYTRVHQPSSHRGSMFHQLRSLALTADSLCHGDILEKTIRKDSHWELLPLQAFLSSVIPGEHIRGSLLHPFFPQWLGMHSKTTRCDRLLQELQRHTRLVTSCNKTEFGLEYLPFLAPKLTQPLVAKSNEGVAEVVNSMTSYDLQRDDWEAITELAHYSGRPEITIPSQVKGAFTRSFNKAGHLSHYASTGATAKRSRPQGDSAAEWNGDQEEENGDDGELESDKGVGIDKDPAIKVVKKTKGKSNGKEGRGQKNGKRKK